MFDPIVQQLQKTNSEIEYAAILSVWLRNWSLSVSKGNETSTPGALLVSFCASNHPSELPRLIKNLKYTKHYPKSDFHIPLPRVEEVIEQSVRILFATQQSPAAHIALLKEVRTMAGVFWDKHSFKKNKYAHLLSEYNDANRLMEATVYAYNHPSNSLSLEEKTAILQEGGEVFVARLFEKCLGHEYSYTYWKDALQNTITHQGLMYVILKAIGSPRAPQEDIKNVIASKSVSMQDLFDNMKKWNDDTFYYLEHEASSITKVYLAAQHPDHEKKIKNIYPSIDRHKQTWRNLFAVLEPTQAVSEEHAQVLERIVPYLGFDKEQHAKWESILMNSVTPNKPSTKSKNKI